MSQRPMDNRSPGGTARRYLARLSKAFPGSRSWNRSPSFWPDGAKLVISVSLQFEAGAQAGSIKTPLAGLDGYADLPITHAVEYGLKEGLPRLLEILSRRCVQGTFHMASSAVGRGPQLAKEIVERGHEGAAQGQAWATPYAITVDEERAAYEANIEDIAWATGIRPVGFNGFRRRSTPQTLTILQDLGIVYDVGDAGRDEPSLVSVGAKPFVRIPHTAELNDLVAYELRNYSTEQYAADLKNEFEMLYAEAQSRRRMMAISMHDRITGYPARAKILEEFIIYAQRRPGVEFMRKDAIARFALTSSITPEDEQSTQGADAA